MTETEPKKKARRGFSAMDPAKQKELASKGGKAAHARGTAHEFTAEEARTAGKLGGKKSSANRDHMAAIGRKGGAAVAADRAHMSEIGKKGGKTRAGGQERPSEDASEDKSSASDE